MTIKELTEGIAEQKYKNPTAIEDKFYNSGIDFCLKMIDLYAKYKEPEDYPFGRNDYQE